MNGIFYQQDVTRDLEQYQIAESQFRAIQHLTPENLYHLGICYLKQRSIHKAYLERAISTFQKIKEKSDYRWLGLAECYSATGNYQESIEQYQNIPKYQSKVTVLMPMADCYMDAKNNKEAIYWYETLLALNILSIGKSFVAKKNLVHCYQLEKMYDKAIPVYLEIIAQNNDPTYKHELAKCYQNIHQYQAALDCYLALPNEYVINKHDIKLATAQCYLELKLYQNAMDVLTDVITNPDDKELLLVFGKSSYMLGKYEDAYHYYKRIDLSELDNEIQFHLANCCEKLHKYDEAITYYQSISDIENDKLALSNLIACMQQEKLFPESLKYINSYQEN